VRDYLCVLLTLFCHRGVWMCASVWVCGVCGYVLVCGYGYVDMCLCEGVGVCIIMCLCEGVGVWLPVCLLLAVV